MKIKNIIFDFDGTLADTAEVIMTTMKATVQELGLPPRQDADYHGSIGLRLEEIPGHLWPDITDLSATYAATYRRLFDSFKESIETGPFPGVVPTIEYLGREGINLAVASSRSHRSLQEYCGHLGLAGHFKMLIGGDDVNNGKPAPEPVLTITEALGWNPGETLVVGDAGVDILMGKRAGCHTCGVTYGNGTVAELEEAGADAITDSFSDIRNIIMTFK